jgi:hypothetical protein
MNNKKRLSYKIKYERKTAALIKELKDGLLMKFPFENPDIHFTFLAMEGKLSIHHTNETMCGKDRHDNSQRIEIDFNMAVAEDIKQQVENYDWLKYLVVSDYMHAPGRAYLCGFIEQFMGKITGSHEKSTEEILENIYMIRREQLPLCSDRMIIVYDRAGGVKGRWHDTGWLFKHATSKKVVYISFASLNKIIIDFAEMLQLDGFSKGLDFPKRNIFNFDINDRSKKLLLWNGQRIFSNM